ncbi:SAV_6107 family HEPN domain-containing protein, partial [Pseudokineococcus basanitobsidens]
MSTTERTRRAPRTSAGAGPVLAGAPAAAAADLLARAGEGLGASRAATSAGERYVAAHLSALRSAAAVLAVRG